MEEGQRPNINKPFANINTGTFAATNLLPVPKLQDYRMAEARWTATRPAYRSTRSWRDHRFPTSVVRTYFGTRDYITTGQLERGLMYVNGP
jgi:hypothetical protein